MGQLGKRWHKLEGRDLAAEVEKIVDGLDSAYSAHDSRAVLSVSTYEGRSLQSLSPLAYLDSWSSEGALQLNVTRSACDTVLAEISGRQKPKPSFLTNGADYRTRRKAKKHDKFVEAQMRLPQGTYAQTWEVMEDALMDAIITGTGFVYPYADGDSICVERVPPGQVRLDAAEAAAGNPRNWFRRGPIDQDLAAELFCEGEDTESGEPSEKLQAIESAPIYDDKSSTEYSKVCPPIVFTEAWLLPIPGSEKPGRHVIVIGGVVMLEEDWNDTNPPFVVLRWARSRFSFWGKGLVEEGELIANELDENTEKLQARFRLCGAKRTYVYEGSLVDDSKMEENEHESIILVKPGMQFPEERPPSPVGPSEVEWHRSMIDLYYQITGVSQMNATARKETGITAAVAIRTVNDMQSVRFSVKARQYEQAYVALGKAIVRCARQVAENNPGFKLPWPGNRFHGTINWREVDMDDDMYDVQIFPASSLPSSPEGRMQTVQELFQSGAISAPTMKRLLDMPDLEDEMRSENAERERIEFEIDRMLDAEEGTEFEYHPPDGYILDPMGAMVLIGGEYHQAVCEGAPDFNLSLLRGYMANLNTLIERAAAPAPMAGGIQGQPPAQIPGGPAPQAAPPQLPMAAQ